MRWLALLLTATGLTCAVGMLGDYLWANRHNEHTATSWAVFASAAGIAVFIGMHLADGVVDRGANSVSDWWEMTAAGALGTTMFPAWWVIMRVRRAQRRRAGGATAAVE